MIVFKVIYLDFYIPLLCFGTQLSPRPSSWGRWDMRAFYLRFACCKYVPTILSESLAQARVAGTLRPKTERKIWITYSGLPSPPRDVTGKNILIDFAEKNYQISLYNVF